MDSNSIDKKLKNKIIEILKYIDKFNINILLGAGTSIPCMPSMEVLSKAIKDNTKIIDKIKEIQKEHKSNFDFSNNEIENTISLIESKSIIFPEIIQYRELYELIIQKILSLFSDIELQKKENTKNTYKSFLKVLSDIRMINSKNNSSTINIFTTNYDLLIEESLEDLKINYSNGFTGIINRKFDSKIFDYKFVDDIELSNYRYFEKKDYVNLYKLHGSLSWKWDEKINTIVEISNYDSNDKPLVIYPSSSKYGVTLNRIEFYELNYNFKTKLLVPNSILLVFGSSLKDEHLKRNIDSAIGFGRIKVFVFIFEKCDYWEKLKLQDYEIIFWKEETTFQKWINLINDIFQDLNGDNNAT